MGRVTVRPEAVKKYLEKAASQDNGSHPCERIFKRALGKLMSPRRKACQRLHDKPIDRFMFLCIYAYMNTRITLDLQNPKLLTMLRFQVAQEGKTLREVVVEALESYLSHKRENQALLQLANNTFKEWDNPKDSDYDSL